MPITVEEKPDSREGTLGDTAEMTLRYVIRGTADDGEARKALADNTPLLYAGLVRRTLTTTPVFVDIGTPDASIWDGVVRYGRWRRQPDTGESVFEFDTTGGTQHVTQSLQTVGIYAAPGRVATDFQGAIGVTDSGVEGVDITVPVYRWSERHFLDEEMVTEAYKDNLFWLTGRLNAHQFRGRETGEVLFMGSRGARRSDEDWEVSFHFAASPNRRGLQVGSVVGIDKGGWEYLWVQYEKVEDSGSERVATRPRAVYVERVYEHDDFLKMGIGT